MKEINVLSLVSGGIVSLLGLTLLIYVIVVSGKTPEPVPIKFTVSGNAQCEFSATQGIFFRHHNRFQVRVKEDQVDFEFSNNKSQFVSIPLYADKNHYRSFRGKKPPLNQEWYELKLITEGDLLQEIEVAKYKTFNVQQESQYGSSFVARNVSLGTIGICQNIKGKEVESLSR